MSTMSQIHFILRPDASGTWSVQDDVDHESVGVDKITGVIHGDDFVRVYFTPVFLKAGICQITSDDDFAGSLSAHANLGTQSITIKMKFYPNRKWNDPWINPKQIGNYMTNNGGGNLWVSVVMFGPL